MVKLFPKAPVYAAVHIPGAVDGSIGWDVRPFALSRWRRIARLHRWLLPAYPLLWRRLELPPADLVVSNSSAFCHAVRAPDAATHVCYCLTPPRFLWQTRAYLSHEPIPSLAKLAVRASVPVLRRLDREAAGRVSHYVAISSAVRERIQRIYGRDSAVIHPPVDVTDIASTPANTPDGYYVVLARLAPYKQIDLAIEAFTRMGRRLVVIGDGRDRPRLERMAGPSVEFRGRLPQADVWSALAGCRALVWPGVEDFGLAPVEAMAAGRPVLARRAGGVLDTVIEGHTGVFFDEPKPDALSQAVERLEQQTWDSEAIRSHARQFDRAEFATRFREYLSETWSSPRRP
jgi:glycosyltransferase involved in cell wall biosynthesis